jgi:hypothetical protein
MCLPLILDDYSLPRTLFHFPYLYLNLSTEFYNYVLIIFFDLQVHNLHT